LTTLGRCNRGRRHHKRIDIGKASVKVTANRLAFLHRIDILKRSHLLAKPHRRKHRIGKALCALGKRSPMNPGGLRANDCAVTVPGAIEHRFELQIADFSAL